MNKKAIGVIIAIAAVLAVAAVLAFNQHRASLEDTTELPVLFEGIVDQLDDVQTIEIQDNAETVTLEQKDGKWGVVNKGNYTASDSALRLLFVGLGDMEVLEKKTSNPDWYDRLGVQDPTEDDAESVKVTMKSGDGSTIASLIVGKPQPGGARDRLYVRKPDDKQSWLVRSPLKAPGGVDSWLEKTILDVNKDDVESVTLTDEFGETVELVRKDGHGSDWEIANLPEGYDANPVNVLQGPAASLGALKFTDVVPASEIPDDATSETTMVAETFDGERLVAHTYYVEGTPPLYYMTIEASYDPSLRPKDKADEENADETKDENAFKPRPAGEVQNEVEELQQRFEGWAYQVPSWKAQNMRKKLSDLATRSEKVTASHILISYEGASRSSQTRTRDEARAKAEEILARVQENPDDFAEIAMEESDGPSAPKGGDLGEFGRGRMAPPFEAAAFALKPGEISGIVETEFGFHIIKRTK
ncbi:peptidylprolyl isomerase [bacterium]|nr:peptidylprolyl isomerase [bacterium]